MRSWPGLKRTSVQPCRPRSSSTTTEIYAEAATRRPACQEWRWYDGKGPSGGTRAGRSSSCSSRTVEWKIHRDMWSDDTPAPSGSSRLKPHSEGQRRVGLLAPYIEAHARDRTIRLPGSSGARFGWLAQRLREGNRASESELYDLHVISGAW